MSGTTTQSPTCYLCREPVGEDEWCYGCNHYICSDHPVDPLGSHEAGDHDLDDEEGC